MIKNIAMNEGCLRPATRKNVSLPAALPNVDFFAQRAIMRLLNGDHAGVFADDTPCLSEESRNTGNIKYDE